MTIVTTRHRKTPSRIRTLQIILLSLVSIISYGALVLPTLLSPTTVSLQVGDVSPSDFQAPQDIEYISEVRTEDARLAAENAVAPVYAPPDTSNARGQIDRLRNALQYITLVRNDETITCFLSARYLIEWIPPGTSAARFFVTFVQVAPASAVAKTWAASATIAVLKWAGSMTTPRTGPPA
jgi:membrane-associated HD superfamily phosphohydrolase